MIQWNELEFKPGTQEEKLPEFNPDFPYICTWAELPKNTVQSVPWHWHQAVEIFYVEQGQVVHSTPSGEIIFPAGSGGMINSNILHSARVYAAEAGHRRRQHLFDPVLIAGNTGGRIERKYVLPLIAASNIEVIPLMPDNPAHGEILELLRSSFCLDPDEVGYEFRIRAVLSELWLRMMELVAPQLKQKKSDRPSEQIKRMMIFIHENFGNKISAKDIADSACISERACYSLFQKCLHTTPTEYLNSYRLRIAYQMLAQTEESVTEISAVCGMNNSYFCQLFRRATGFTPLEYRRFYQRNQEQINA